MLRQRRTTEELDTAGADAASLTSQLERVLPQPADEIAGQPALPPQLRLSLARLSVIEVVVLALLLALLCTGVVYFALRYAKSPPGAGVTVMPVATGPAVSGPLSQMLQWTYSAGSQNLSLPACSEDGTLFTTLDRRRLLAVTADGAQRFVFTPDAGRKKPEMTAPAAVGLVSAVVGLSDGRVIRVDGWGEAQWSFQTGSEIVGRPAMLPRSELCYVACDDGTVYSITPGGTLNWKCETQLCFRGAGPVVSPRGTVYCVSVDGTLCAVAHGGQLLWQKRLGLKDNLPLLLAPDGRLLVSSGHTLLAYSAEGEELWRFSHQRAISAPPGLDGGGQIFTGNVSGEVYVLSSGGKPVSSLQVSGTITAPPLPGPAGKLYVAASDAKLHAFDATGRSLYELSMGAGAIGLLPLYHGALYYVGADGVVTSLKDLGLGGALLSAWPIIPV